MALNPFDLVLGLLILLLGFKGALTGFRRELFGFVGLIGGVFIASRAADPLAGLVERHLFTLNNPAALRLIAFVMILTLFWGGVSLLGRAVEARTGEEIPSPLSRVGGFLLAAAKYFLVFAMILTAFAQTPLIKRSVERHAQSSLLYPLLLPAGKMLITPPSLRNPSPKRQSVAPGKV